MVFTNSYWQDTLINIPFKKRPWASKTIINMYPQEDIHAQYIEDIPCLSTLLWLEVKFPVEPLPQFMY